MHLFHTIIDFFLPAIAKQERLEHYKTRTLMGLILFCCTMTVVTVFITHTIDNRVQYEQFVTLMVFFFVLILFRFLKNSFWIGITISIALCIGAMLEMLETGGVYSDTLHWLVLVPLVALSLSGHRVAFFFLVLFVFYLTWLSFYSYKHFDEIIINLHKMHPITTISSCMMVLVSVYVLAHMQDTSLKMIISEVNQKNVVLEEQAKVLKQKEELLSKTNRELELFAFAASHDMKEPLRMIGMYTQLINKRIKNNDMSNNDEFVGYVTDGVKRMESMLDDLLTYSRLGKEADKKITNLNELLFIVQKNLAVKIKEYEVILTVENMPTLHISTTDFIQLFQNLIANAIKFSREGVQPNIKIKHQMINDRHHFEVQDNGIGIAEEYHEKVFNIFERLHNHTDIKGSGIGLATCQKVIQSLGGNIGVKSIVNEGTTIWFDIPIQNV